MDPGALKLSSPYYYPSPYPSTPTPSSNYIIICRLFFLTFCLPHPTHLSHLLILIIFLCGYPRLLFAPSLPQPINSPLSTACVAPSMPALRPEHSCRFPHTVFARSPAALITSLARAWRSVYPITTGSNPGLLSSSTRQKDVSV